MNDFVFEMMNRGELGMEQRGNYTRGTTVLIINHVDAWCGKIETE